MAGFYFYFECYSSITLAMRFTRFSSLLRVSLRGKIARQISYSTVRTHYL